MILTPFGLIVIAFIICRPLRRVLGFCALVLLVFMVGAFGHVQFINDMPLIAFPIAATPYLLGWWARLKPEGAR